MTRSLGFWNLIAKKYSRDQIADMETYERKLEQTQALFSPRDQVLEFGCGTGSTALIHAPHVGHITATDYSPKMIDIARSKLGEVTNVSFEVSTLEQWSAPPASYDVVMGLNILHLLPDHRRALAKAYELLKPGGYMVTSTACIGEMNGVLRTILPIASALRVLPYVAVFTQDEFEADLRAAGFEIQSGWRPSPTNAAFHICRKPA